MNTLVALFWMLALLNVSVGGEEPVCPKYHYDTQNLERIIKSEINWETTRQVVQTSKEEIRELQDRYRVDVQRLQNNFNVLAIAFKELQENITAVTSAHQDSMRSFCTSQDHCQDVTGSECKWLTCKCKPGLSYHRATSQCLVDCGRYGYGDTYQEERGAAIKDLNNKISYRVSLEECIALCTSETDFICRSIEYNSGERRCHLTVFTLYTKMEEVYDKAPEGWDYFFTRNCK